MPLHLQRPAAHTPQALRRPARQWAGVVVLLLHLVLLGAGQQLGAWHERGPSPAPQPPLMLWLPERTAAATAALPTTPVPPDVARQRSAPPAPVPLPPPRARTPAAPGETQAITLPPAGEPPGAQHEAQTTTAPAPPAAPGPAPLNLSLPRAASSPWRQRNPALDDARANTRTPVDMGLLLQQALGGDPRGPISEEALADGSVRFRRGSQCVIARPNQAQGLDPYNGSVLPKPRLLDKC